jgi:eukaryotic-like serine/threonine-protein kinase
MDRIGEYLVARLLGEGGMGKVYLAEERLSKRPVALKLLRPELARAEEGRRLFLNEMTILAHLDHPNVVRCLACQEIDDQLVMVLEYLEGKTLRDVLAERGRLPWTEAVAVLVQIASGLSAAHGQTPPIVHRDLKPDNVFVLPNGRVKVMDFGIAKVLEALSHSTTHSVGTLQYMSPEQIDAGDVGPRSDLYALGLCLYEMLCGQPPFVSPSPRELLNLQCTAEAPPLPDDVRRGLPQGIARLLGRMLQKRPEDRPADAAEVLAALEPFRTADDVLPTAPRATTERVEEAVSIRRAAAPAPDTIALVQRAAGPRQVSGTMGLLVIVTLSVLAGVVTYVLRTRTAAGADVPPPAAAIASGTAGGP